MDSRLTVQLKRGGRRPKSHGGYSFLTKGELPESRPQILKYLMAARQGLVRDLGPTENDLTTAQIILIDRITTKLGVIRCMEEFINGRSVIKGDELAPCLKASYLAYSNSIRLDLQALGTPRRTEAIMAPYEIVQMEKKEDSDEHH